MCQTLKHCRSQIKAPGVWHLTPCRWGVSQLGWGKSTSQEPDDAYLFITSRCRRNQNVLYRQWFLNSRLQSCVLITHPGGGGGNIYIGRIPTVSVSLWKEKQKEKKPGNLKVPNSREKFTGQKWVACRTQKRERSSGCAVSECPPPPPALLLLCLGPDRHSPGERRVIL